MGNTCVIKQFKHGGQLRHLSWLYSSSLEFSGKPGPGAGKSGTNTDEAELIWVPALDVESEHKAPSAPRGVACTAEELPSGVLSSRVRAVYF